MQTEPSSVRASMDSLQSHQLVVCTKEHDVFFCELRAEDLILTDTPADAICELTLDSISLTQ